MAVPGLNEAGAGFEKTLEFKNVNGHWCRKGRAPGKSSTEHMSGPLARLCSYGRKYFRGTI